MARPVDPARRRALIAAAARLFRRYGYARTTARDIARALGVQSGSIFYHFNSKEDLLIAVMIEGMQPFSVMAHGPPAQTGAPLSRLRALFHGHLSVLHGAGDEQAVVVQEWDKVAPRVRQRVVRLRDDIETVWREVLEACAAAGLLHGDLRILRLSILGALNWTLQWYQPRGELDVDQLADRLLAVFVPAVAAGAAARVTRPRGRFRVIPRKAQSKP